MRVALFASGGEIPIHALEYLARICTVVAVIRPRSHWPHALRAVARRILRGSAIDDLALRTAALRIDEWSMNGPADPSIAARLSAARVDLACIATYPWRLTEAVLTSPTLGAVNLHASLLPRHRGPNPWFWTYHSDDREAGVTAHVCEPRIDRGPILAQARWDLRRGYPIAALHRDVAERGASLLGEVLASAQSGALSGVPQDDSIATRAPRVPSGTQMIDPTWPAERVWHFLAGTAGQYHEPLHCGGRPIRYAAVAGFETAASRQPPGHVEPDSDQQGWKIWCPDGFVRIDAVAPR